MFKYLKSILFYYNQYVVESAHDETLQIKITIVNMISCVGMGITAILGINAGYHGQYLLMLALLFTSVILFIVYIRQRINTSTYKHSAFLVVLSLNILLLFLIFSGGVENTGPLWMYIVPAVALFLGGLIKGLINVSIFLACFCILMFYHDGQLLAEQTYYSEAYKLRLLYSFLSVTFMCSCYEYFSQASFSRLQQLTVRFEEQAKIDPLTGLSNRRDIMDVLQKEYARIQRQQGPAAILLCDIDDFKKVNDLFGHESGDMLLQQISTQFNSLIRKQDNVARWGGEEFLFLLPDTSFDDAINLAEKLRKNTEQTKFALASTDYQATVSIGVAVLVEDTSIVDAIASADKQLYEAKNSGKNKVCGLQSSPAQLQLEAEFS